jgi:hypothetical protein
VEWVYPEIRALFPQNTTAPVVSGALSQRLEKGVEAL